ncbi:MAG: tetratricopeptide repeat protein [Gemmatimonadaceae bacterium]
MTRTGSAGRPDLEERTESFMEWATLHTREIGIGVAVVAVLALGAFFYGQTRQSRANNAERALAEAQQAFSSGNQALALSDLQRVVNRFTGTPAADQAALLLVQLMYDGGKYADGIAQLAKIDRGDAFRDAAIESLTAIGFEQQGKFPEAAEHYRKASDRTPYPTDKASYLANAARALVSANNKAEAVKIWTQLASDPAGPMAAEARVRLGELEAKPAARS